MKEKEKLRKNKFMRNKKSFIFLLILCLGVGFAFLTSNLTITGNTSVSGNKWSVYFNSVDVSTGSVEATVDPAVTGTTTTSLNYTVLLDKPGDYYEFTVEAKNDGTIDAMIESITTPSIESRVLQYMNYSVKYLDGTDVLVSDVLKAKTSTTYKIRIEYRTDISASDLDENGVDLNLSFGVDYTQSTITDSIFASSVRSSALIDKTIDFSEISSVSNGQGLYVLSGTENRSHPIYYYRGDVSNNNAKFAGFCWKIVRTTETGGTKLLYNGLPDSNGYCSNTTGEATQLSSTSLYNENGKSPAYTGYMYGETYEVANQLPDTNYLFGKTFTYSNGTYTIDDTISSTEASDDYHYTCFNVSGTCSELSYVYKSVSWDSSKMYSITLTNGKSVEDALAEMNTNSSDSTIKGAVDNWFNNTFKTYFTNVSKNYNDYLEDTVWCNDRSMNTLGSNTQYINNGWIPNGGSLGNDFYYSSYGRIASTTPSLVCPNKNDAFTVSDTVNGNGALTYPVGLLTADEVNLAGGMQGSFNEDFYLNTNQKWWTMTPNYFSYSYAYNYVVFSDGNLASGASSDLFGTPLGVRPSISVKSSVKIVSGRDGTSTSPYEFVVE